MTRQRGGDMLAILLGIFLLSLAALTTELTIIRVFDVILTSNTAYMVVTCALFAFGVAGVWRALRPAPADLDIRKAGTHLSLLFAASAALILPASNLLPLNYREILEHPVQQLAAFGALYLVVSLPFFFVGLLLSTVFTAYAGAITRLYFWDLAGAAMGCLIVAPLFPLIGPGGLLLMLAGVGCLAAALFSTTLRLSRSCIAAGVILLVLPLLLPSQVLEFRNHMDKRGVKTAAEEGRIEFSRWDPISKIDVFDSGEYEQNGRPVRFKHVAYDGGQQSTFIYPFDGNLAGLRDDLENGRTDIEKHFWFSGVAAAHYLKADSRQRVLVIGAAGGQETKAALMFRAAEVDAVEMVGTVIELGKQKYRDYNGFIFQDSRVRAVQGEGRSFLRQSATRYDIIQVFSNHTSSSIASGTGAMQTSYLQTAEAYQEYFEHLTENGVLQVNHHVFPRMISTAALAWSRMGRTDFRAHVAVWQRPGEDHLPTMLIKMQRWTPEELQRVQDWFTLFEHEGNVLVENPVDSEVSFLPGGFFDAPFDETLADMARFRTTPATDDRPYFNFLRKYVGLVEPDPRGFLDEATAQLLNSQMKGPIPFDQMHLYVTAAAGGFFALIVILLPLAFSRAGRAPWLGRPATLTYFACLGCGFIIIELVFIQSLMRLIGSPLHTYTAVMVGLLISAGLGSLLSPRLRVVPNGRRALPFMGILFCGALFLLWHEALANLFLAAPLLVRVIAAMMMTMPIGFFLGMPFPLGIAMLDRGPPGAIAWAWAMNSLLTVIGAIASVLLSLFWGFQATLLIALGIYGVAFAALARMHHLAEDTVMTSAPEIRFGTLAGDSLTEVPEVVRRT